MEILILHQPINHQVVSALAPESPQAILQHPFSNYSLRGEAARLDALVKSEISILGRIALKGQATVIYAAPNAGKTLLTLYLICSAIDDGIIDSNRLYYVNMDDSASGLIQKLYLAEAHGFHMLSAGHQGFDAKIFPAKLQEIVDTGHAHDTVVILDTLKNFTDLMDKGRSSKFTTLVRHFILHGGTLIALAHTNKKPGPDGEPVHGGTTDIVDDFDCAYTIKVLANHDDDSRKLVVFKNIKRRGDVAQSVGFTYSHDEKLTYLDRLNSVQEVDPKQLAPMERKADLSSDASAIEAVRTSILSGVNMKMSLASAIVTATQVSRRHALKILEKYTGDEVGRHLWVFKVGAHGAMAYSLLDPVSHG